MAWTSPLFPVLRSGEGEDTSIPATSLKFKRMKKAPHLRGVDTTFTKVAFSTTIFPYKTVFSFSPTPRENKIKEVLP
jgi:hypothetical protein